MLLSSRVATQIFKILAIRCQTTLACAFELSSVPFMTTACMEGARRISQHEVTLGRKPMSALPAVHFQPDEALTRSLKSADPLIVGQAA